MWLYRRYGVWDGVITICATAGGGHIDGSAEPNKRKTCVPLVKLAILFRNSPTHYTLS